MTKKRGNGEGSISPRKDGRYEARITYRDAAGVSRRKSIYGATRADVKDELVKLQRDVQQGIPIKTERITVETFINRWLDSAKVRPSTLASYRSYVNNHIIPSLGKTQLDKLTAHDVQVFLDRLSKPGLSTRAKQGLSPRSVQYIRAILRKALSHAMRQDLVQRNVVSRTDAPSSVRHEIAPLTSAEVQAFLTFLAAHRDDDDREGRSIARLENLYVAAMGTGMRQGELLGLRWRDIDFDNRTLTVRNQLQKIDGQPQLVPTKTDRSRRTLTLSAIVAGSLKRQRARQLRDKAKYRPYWHEPIEGLVFTSQIGTPLDSSNVTHAFQKALQAAEMRHQRFHDLRHCAATLLLAQGAELRDIMDQLGHSTIVLTANTYTHLMPARRRALADMMDAAMNGT